MVTDPKHSKLCLDLKFTEWIRPSNWAKILLFDVKSILLKAVFYEILETGLYHNLLQFLSENFMLMSVFFLEKYPWPVYIFTRSIHHSNEYQSTTLFLNRVLKCGLGKFWNLTWNLFLKNAPCKSILIWPICFDEKSLGFRREEGMRISLQ